MKNIGGGLEGMEILRAALVRTGSRKILGGKTWETNKPENGRRVSPLFAGRDRTWYRSRGTK